MSTKRLNSTLAEQRELISKSKNNNNSKQIVHLGLGAFHRAHQAVYTDKANHVTEENWSIIGVSLRSGNVRDQLVPQNNLYSVIETDVSGNQHNVINVIKDVLVAPESPEAVLQVMNKPETEIVSLTITEKGYCNDPASGQLDKSNSDIQHDLKNLSSPKTAIGFLVSSLQARYKNNATPFTVLCCDNLPSNGDTLGKIIVEFAQEIDPELASWIQNQVPFPNTMVDRIVPATTEHDIAEFAAESGYQDLAMVKTERFSQWVIEDNFVSGRPAWDRVAVSLVKDVEPFENAKLRLLNGAHSSLAYLGYLKGYDYVHQVMEDSDLANFLKNMMQNEIIPTIAAPEGLDLVAYSNELLKRFSNPALNHRTYQIAMDGSQKMPQRLLHTIEDRLDVDAGCDSLCFAVAGWLRYSMGFDLKGDPIDVQDPFSAELLAIQQKDFYEIDNLIEGYLSFDKVFSTRLKNSDVFRYKLTYWLGIILANGVDTALKILLLETNNNKKSQSL